MRRLVPVACLLLVLSMPFVCDAELWNYAAVGAVTLEGSEEPSVVTGNVVIDDRLYTWGDGTPAPRNPPVGYQYGFLIRQFSLNVGGLKFSGSSPTLDQSQGKDLSCLYLEVTFDGSFTDLMWFLEGEGDLAPYLYYGQWLGAPFRFYGPDGTAVPWRFPEYGRLAPIIKWSSGSYENLPGTIWLIRTGKGKVDDHGKPRER